MDLNFRLQLLHDSGQIDENCKVAIERVITWFEGALKIKLTEDNASMFVTHLAMAVSRMQKGEPVAGPDEAVFEEIRNCEVYEQSKVIVAEICAMLPVILPQPEQDFLFVHIVPLMINIKNI